MFGWWGGGGGDAKPFYVLKLVIWGLLGGQKFSGGFVLGRKICQGLFLELTKSVPLCSQFCVKELYQF